MGYTERKIKFEDIKGVTRSRKSKDRHHKDQKDRQHKDQKDRQHKQHNDQQDKQRSTKHYTEN